MTLLLGPPGSGKTTLLLALSGKLDQSLKVTGEISYNGYKLEEFIPQKTSAYISQHDLHIPEMTVRETVDFSACFQGVGSRADIMMEVSRREKQEGILPDPYVDTYMKAISVEGTEKSLQTDYILKILGLDICADSMVGDAMRRGISGGQKKRLTTEGKIVYHGPRDGVIEFFEECGFRCPERKGAADFLQEVISKNDQAQYWYSTEKLYSYVSVDEFSRKFKASNIGHKLYGELSEPYDKSQSHKNAISFNMYSLSKWELFKACMSREFLLMRRNYFVYVFKSVQLTIIASITMTLFLRTRMSVDLQHANYYMSSLFFGLMVVMADGYPELSMTVSRLSVFYKQRESCFYPAWAYAIPAAILKIPLSVIASLIWSALTYYVIGYSPEFTRFLRQFILLFAVHLMSISMFRFVASLSKTHVAAMASGVMTWLVLLLFSGFIIPQPYMPVWLKWGFWVSPLTYGEIGMTVNEFLAPRWQKMSTNSTLSQQILESRGLNFESYFYWISFGVLFGFAILFNIGFTLTLTFSKPPEKSRAIISYEKLSQIQGKDDSVNVYAEDKPNNAYPKRIAETRKGKMVLPFEPLTVVFQDLQYYIDTPLEMRERGFTQKRLQLLHDITGSFKPGVLTALMGVSGAGKTTLMDVLSGRKTGGYIEGTIMIGGYPKVQETFARISGYCEQNDIHSPQITVQESVIYSAWLRLSPQIDANAKAEFVNEVLETIELDGIKDSLVGIPGVNGLSTEQRKRLTIAVELVANPSIIFLDEPTSGLDARAAAIVIRAVKNVVDTGRTIVCTIHQPSIDIFETFDELILMKTGGRIIYAGPLGQRSSKVIEYFESISGVPKIKDNYNPATWMLEVTSTSAETEVGVDFAQLYKESSLYEDNNELVKKLSTPPPASKDLHFPTRYPQNGWGQFKVCLWKQNLSYWRSPNYNLRRFAFTFIASLLFGALFWKQGQKINTEQDLFNILGGMYVAVLQIGINNSTAVLPFVSMERTVLYRERAAGMYSSWAYSFAQVVIELPYIFSQVCMYVIITYPMIGYYPSAYKILWYTYAMFCVLLSFNYIGMLLVAVTPSIHIATILSPAFNISMNLLAGFLIPRPQIPTWWLWLYYLVPTSWTLNGLLTSQYGDIETEIMALGETQTVSTFISNYFGFSYNRLNTVAVVLIFYPVAFAFVFSYCIGKLNFQKR
ncbi:pleiotropic drug resistance protein 3-like isoform X1 [Telopea speciosissima]|uniref:pleiotropic drug resistance protein 3-like isoform X1 n=1 Tax=Telopea speciosissima TaxID=54955 RepID=UPI001CC50F9E|nr:pleiotropic drug resistance protein 3-like isoform X1 [Telopea speciosissima]